MPSQPLPARSVASQAGRNHVGLIIEQTLAALRVALSLSPSRSQSLSPDGPPQLDEAALSIVPAGGIESGESRTHTREQSPSAAIAVYGSGTAPSVPELLVRYPRRHPSRGASRGSVWPLGAGLGEPSGKNPDPFASPDPCAVARSIGSAGDAGAAELQLHDGAGVPATGPVCRPRLQLPIGGRGLVDEMAGGHLVCVCACCAWSGLMWFRLVWSGGKSKAARCPVAGLTASPPADAVQHRNICQLVRTRTATSRCAGRGSTGHARFRGAGQAADMRVGAGATLRVGVAICRIGVH